jgi:hypothetical protein
MIREAADCKPHHPRLEIQRHGEASNDHVDGSEGRQ